MSKLINLSFPDGTRIEGFQWSMMGWYYRRFPQSGIHSEPFNTLQFTPEAILEHGIATEESHAETQFAAVGRGIVQGNDVIAQSKSHTMAKRIANALNHYTPGRRGC